MNYESIKKEYIKLKKEELEFIDNVSKMSSNRILSESEKLEIYRRIKKYESELYEILTKLSREMSKIITIENRNTVLVEFAVDKNYLSSLTANSSCYYKKIIFTKLGIDIKTNQYVLTIKDLLYKKDFYRIFHIDFIQNNQKLIEKPIYIFLGYSSGDCCGPYLGDSEDYIYGRYVDICDSDNITIMEISKKEMDAFEKDRTIIYSTAYVKSFEIKEIFENELLNYQNKSIHDCIEATRKRIEEFNYVRSHEYKEKALLDKINILYQKVKGEFIHRDVLYNGNFIEIIRETYKLPNGKNFEREKVIKNGGKNSVIVIAITQDKKFIITFQNRIKDEKIAEFPSGYIENDEDPVEAANRELLEETGYTSDDLFVVDEVFTSPGIDNSVTYVVIANNCIKTTHKRKTNGTEFVIFGLFSKEELKYFISHNIMNGAMNKLAYYHLININEDCPIIYNKINERGQKTFCNYKK